MIQTSTKKTDINRVGGVAKKMICCVATAFYSSCIMYSWHRLQKTVASCISNFLLRRPVLFYEFVRVGKLKFFIFPFKFFSFFILTFILFFSGCSSANQRIALLENRAAAIEIENERLQAQLLQYNQNFSTTKQKDVNIRNRSAKIQADIAEIQDRIELLTERFDELRDDFDKRIDAVKNLREKKDAHISGRSAETRADITEIQDRIQHLTGHVDEIEHDFKNKTEEIKTSIEKINDLLSNFSKKIDLQNDRSNRFLQSSGPGKKTNRSAAKYASVLKPEVAAQSKLPPKSGRDLYESAKIAFDKNNFQTAKKKFRDFFKKNPASPLAGNSQFWIGEIYYLEKKYEKAIIKYQNVIEKYPDSGKVPAALLKQGLSFAELADRQSSVLFFNELIRRFPGSKEAEIAGKKLHDLQ